MIYNKMKKFFSTLLLITFMVNMLPSVLVFADGPSGKCGENVTYSLNESTGELTISGSGNMSSYGIYMAVPWFQSGFRHLIKSVVIKNGVTSIGQWAFAYCTNLRSIKIPKSVTSIEDRAFEGCTSLASIDLPGNVTSIGSVVFKNCNRLTSIIIPKNVATIGDFAFDSCEKLNSITYLGTTEPTSGRLVFKNCVELFEVKVSTNYQGTYFCEMDVKRINISKISKKSKNQITSEESLIPSEYEKDDNGCCCNIA